MRPPPIGGGSGGRADAAAQRAPGRKDSKPGARQPGARARGAAAAPAAAAAAAGVSGPGAEWVRKGGKEGGRGARSPVAGCADRGGLAPRRLGPRLVGPTRLPRFTRARSGRGAGRPELAVPPPPEAPSLPAALESWLRGLEPRAAGPYIGVGGLGAGRAGGSTEVTGAGGLRGPCLSRLTALTSLTSCTSCVPAGAEDTAPRWGRRKGCQQWSERAWCLHGSRRQRGRGDSLWSGVGGQAEEAAHESTSCWEKVPAESCRTPGRLLEVREPRGWGLSSREGPRWVPGTGSWGRGGPPGAQPRVSGTGEQLPAGAPDLPLTASAAPRLSVHEPGRPGPRPPWRVRCSC